MFFSTALDLHSQLVEWHHHLSSAIFRRWASNHNVQRFQYLSHVTKGFQQHKTGRLVTKSTLTGITTTTYSHQKNSSEPLVAGGWLYGCFFLITMITASDHQQLRKERTNFLSAGWNYIFHSPGSIFVYITDVSFTQKISNQHTILGDISPTPPAYMSWRTNLWWCFFWGGATINLGKASLGEVEDIHLYFLLVMFPPDFRIFHLLQSWSSNYSQYQLWGKGNRFFGGCRIIPSAPPPPRCGTQMFVPFISSYSSWWFQPIWKILVKLDHFPK